MRENDIASGRDPDAEFDLATYFTHDLSPQLVADLDRAEGADAPEIFDDPCDFAAWPDVPLQVIAGRDDRFFPVAFQRRVAHDRLGVDVAEVPGGHLAPLSHPVQVAELLLSGARTP